MSRLILLAILLAVLTLASASPLVNNEVEEKQGSVYSFESEEKAIKHKTTTLLAEALQMIHKSKDVKERKWLESFVRRLAKLASGLERNLADNNRYDNKIKNQDKIMPLQNANEVIVNSKKQSTLSLVGKLDNIYSQTSSVADPGSRELMDEFNPQIRVPEATPEVKVTSAHRQMSLRMLPQETTMMATDESISTTPSENLHRVELQQQVFERNILLKQIFSKIQKLKQIGGTRQDIVDLLKRADDDNDSSQIDQDNEFEEEEEGAAIGELDAEMADANTLAPSLGQIGNTIVSSPKKIDDDYLVKQLEEEKFLLVTTDVTFKENDDDILRRVNELSAPSVV